MCFISGVVPEDLISLTTDEILGLPSGPAAEADVETDGVCDLSIPRSSPSPERQGKQTELQESLPDTASHWRLDV